MADKLTALGDKRGWEKGIPAEVDARRFWAWVEKSDGCWLWRGPLTHDGYGRFSSRVLGRRMRAHAFSVYLSTGKVPTLCCCHKCDTPLCVRPDHIFEGTAGDNLRDMYAKGRGGDRRNFGERNAKSKLTKEKARAIKDRYAAGEGLSDLGREFGVTPQSIFAIVRGKNWVSA